MRISLVIPAYNEEHYLRACLESVFAQSRKPDEVIVVDNNSTDRTAEIAKHFPVRIVSEKKQGIVHARNSGFNAAQGDIIARCDADDVLPERWLERVEWNFKTHDIDAITGPLVLYEAPVKSVFFTNSFLFCIKCIQGWREPLIGANMAITREAWLSVRDRLYMDDRKVHEDIDLGINLLKIGGRIRRDAHLFVHSSGRRMLHRPTSFFIEYPTRLMKTLVRNAHPNRRVASNDRIRPHRRRLVVPASLRLLQRGMNRAQRPRAQTSGARHPKSAASPPKLQPVPRPRKANTASLPAE